MSSFFTLRCRPTSETSRAGILVVCFILVLGTIANLVPDRFLRPAGVIGTIYYLTAYFVALSYARRQRSFAALGITGGHWLVAVVVGVLPS